MQKATAILIDRLITSQVNNDGNHDVYDTRLHNPKYDVVPWIIYFYYIAFDHQGQPVIRHYFHNEQKEIPQDQIKDKIKDLAMRARKSDPTLRIIGYDFHKIEWKHKSYIAIFMDSPYWKILPRDSHPDRSAVVFNTKKNGGPNNSFFDAEDFTVDVGEDGIVETRSAVYFINHMKKSEFGDDIGYDQNGKDVPQSAPYSFDVYFDVARSEHGPSSIFIIDPDGTNMGPPLGPP